MTLRTRIPSWRESCRRLARGSPRCWTIFGSSLGACTPRRCATSASNERSVALPGAQPSRRRSRPAGMGAIHLRSRQQSISAASKAFTSHGTQVLTRGPRCPPLAGDGDLCFSIEDDGVGAKADSVRDGSELANMADRLGALGGTVTVEARSPRGTGVHGSVPLPGSRTAV